MTMKLLASPVLAVARPTLVLFALFTGGREAAQAIGGRAAAQAVGITPLQVMRLRHVLAVYPSPDGKHLAFARSEPRLAGDPPGPDYVHLWIMSDLRSARGATDRGVRLPGTRTLPGPSNSKRVSVKPQRWG